MNAHDVAAAIIARSGAVDALKLQKLLFLSAGEYLALTGRTMFDEAIEAWDYGPVVHTVYIEYKANEGEGTIDQATKGDAEALSDVAASCVISAVDRYGHMTGPELINLTHEMDPWSKSYRPGQYRTPIDPQLVYDYFNKAPTPQQFAEALSAWNASMGIPTSA
jgi:uncharacterized phage-associated protein